MKNCLFLFLFWVSIPMFSQESKDKIVYLDSLMRDTDEGNHIFYTVIKDFAIAKVEHQVFTYFKSKNLKNETTRTDNGFGFINGLSTDYFENGKMQKKVSYIKGGLVGENIVWNENGNIQEVGLYIEQKSKDFKLENTYKLLQFYDEANNQIITNGQGFYKHCSSDKICEEGQYVNGFRTGIFTGQNLANKSTFVEQYKDGKLTSGITTLENKEIIKYSEVAKKPEPSKGMEHFYNFIGKNFKTSEDIPENGVKIKILVNFLIDVDGKLVEPRVINKVGFGMEEEALRVIKIYKDWTAASIRGIKIKFLYQFPITIYNGK